MRQCAKTATTVSLTMLVWLAFATVATVPATASAQVRRCTTSDGQPLYTDRRCEDLGATERRLPTGSGTGQRLPYRGGCARQLQDLMFEVSTAIDGSDANRLAGVYHWPGLSSRSGYAIVSRLDAIVRRPLADIRVLRHSERAAPGAAGATDATYYAQHESRLPPVGLRIDQVLADGVTPTHTTFGLRRHMGCWWVSL
jgi:hypothetical protein